MQKFPKKLRSIKFVPKWNSFSDIWNSLFFDHVVLVVPDESFMGFLFPSTTSGNITLVISISFRLHCGRKYVNNATLLVEGNDWFTSFLSPTLNCSSPINIVLIGTPLQVLHVVVEFILVLMINLW